MLHDTKGIVSAGGELLSEPSLDVLCTTCMRIFDKHAAWKRDSSIQAHHHIKLLRKSAAEGCHLCVLLLRAIDCVEQPTQYFRWPRAILELVESDEYRVWISLHPEPGPGWNSWNFRLAVYPCNIYEGHGGNSRIAELPVSSIDRSTTGPPGHSEEGPGTVLKREISFSTSSNETIRQVQAWMHDCSSRHDPCNRNSRVWSARDQLPTRLLSLSGGSTAEFVRLIESAMLPADTTYATLSHCWGGALAMKLTKDSLEMFKKNISLTTLPQTFRDAIWLAHKLGFKYLWIDALCIIQDSSEDWRAEASRMAAVYANSSVNIMAMASENSHEGLFRLRNPLAIVPCKVQATWKCYNTREFYIAPNLGSLEEDHHLPLNQRAWVLQERLLSPRIIAFGPQQVYWTCRTCRSSETFPEGERLSKSHLRTSLGEPHLSQAWGKHEKLDLEHVWLNLVEEYTRLQLTFESDRLVAISGLAKMIHRTSQGFLGQYFAGLWEHAVVAQLAWRAHSWDFGEMIPNSVVEIRRSSRTKSYKKLRPLSYLAPSWSWASVNGPVDYRYIVKPLLQVYAALTGPVQDPYGAVKGGSLKVQALLCQARISYDEVHNWTVATLENYPHSEVRVICWWSHPCPAAPQHHISDLPHDIIAWLMPLGLTNSGGGAGLVLLPTAGFNEQFKRIGLFEWDSEDELSLIKTANFSLGKERKQGSNFGGNVIEII